MIILDHGDDQILIQWDNVDWICWEVEEEEEEMKKINLDSENAGRLLIDWSITDYN